MAALTTYSADSSALIHGWRRIYRPKNFRFVWNRLGVLIEEGRLKASIEVYNDLGKKTTSFSNGARSVNTSSLSRLTTPFKPTSRGLWEPIHGSLIP